MAEKEKVPREHVQTFDEFSAEEKKYREEIWKEQQSIPSPGPGEPRFRGWLEGKSNPVLPEDAATLPKQDMASPSGTKLADMFPRAVPGKTYPVPDPSLVRRPSYTDRVACYPAADKGNAELVLCGCWSDVLTKFVQRKSSCWLTSSAFCLLLTCVTNIRLSSLSCDFAIDFIVSQSRTTLTTA